MITTLFSNEQYIIKRFILGPLKTNCYVLINNNNNDAVIIDPGYYDSMLTDWLKSNNVIPRIILLTHCHFDHILGIKMFPNIPTYVNENDIELLLDDNKNAAKMFDASVDYSKNDIIRFKDGFKIPCDFVDIKIIHTPGHTKGSTTYLAFEKILFTGDAIFAGTVGRSDLWGGSEQETKETVRKICNLKKDYSIYPGHGRTSTLNAEKCNNPHFLQF